MAHHVKEWDVPDCPNCGAELAGRTMYQGKHYTNQVRWWTCEECGYETEKLPSEVWWEKYPDEMLGR